jgi:hypothetical protein
MQPVSLLLIQSLLKQDPYIPNQCKRLRMAMLLNIIVSLDIHLAGRHSGLKLFPVVVDISRTVNWRSVSQRYDPQQQQMCAVSLTSDHASIHKKPLITAVVTC